MRVVLADGSEVDLDPEPCLECFDGWVPGDGGIERCDECKRFENDDQARDHVQKILEALWFGNDCLPDCPDWIWHVVHSTGPPPRCGHSHCRQNWIDTGNHLHVEMEGPFPRPERAKPHP